MASHRSVIQQLGGILGSRQASRSTAICRAREVGDILGLTNGMQIFRTCFRLLNGGNDYRRAGNLKRRLLDERLFYSWVDERERKNGEEEGVFGNSLNVF